MNKLLLVFLFFIPLFVMGQGGTFIKTCNKAGRYTSLESLQAYGLIHSYDNGYLIVGKNEDNNHLIILETDAVGDIIWSRKYNIGNVSGNEYFKVIHTSDSCYLVTGGVYDGIFSLKISKAGQIIWFKKLLVKFEYGLGYVKSLLEVNQSEYIVLAEDRNSTNNFCFKLDKNGNLLWSKNFYNNGSALKGLSIEKLNEDKFVLTGISAINENSFVIILDSTLNNLKGFKYENANCVAMSVNNNKVVLLLTQQENSYLMSIDTNGKMFSRSKITWVGFLYNSYYPPNTFMVQYNKDSTYICTRNAIQSSLRVIKLDKTGKMIYALNPQFYKIGNFAQHVTDSSVTILGNGALMGSKTESYSRHFGLIKVDSKGDSKGCVNKLNSFVTVDTVYNGTNYAISNRDTGQIIDITASMDSVLIKVDSGCLGYVGHLNETGNNYNVKVLPTAVNHVFSIVTDQNDFELWVTNLVGQTVYRRMCKNKDNIQIDLSNESKGVYVVRLQFGDGIYTSKILVE